MTGLARALAPGEDGRPAIEWAGGVLSYRDLRRLASETARALRRLSVRPGDRVLLALPNSPEFFAGFLGAAQARALPVPLDASPGSDRFAWAMERLQGRVALTPAGFRADPSAGGVRCEPIRRRAGRGGPRPPGDAAAIFLSSGSTGAPKAVTLSRAQLLAAARNLAAASGLGPGHRELLLSPACHMDGWQRAAAALLSRGCVIIPEALPSASALLEELDVRRAAGVYVPPPMVRPLLAAPRGLKAAAARRLRCLELGSAAVPASALRRLLADFPRARVLVHYGLTESSRATLLDCRGRADKLHTVGRAAAGVRVAVLDGAGRPVRERSGQVALRGAQTIRAYWPEDVASRGRFRDGWLLTGDRGALDGDGFLRLLGREDDMINAGGYHFFPAEAEAALAELPGIDELAVAGVPDALMGQLPAAFIVGRKGVERALLREARRRLPHYMVPRRVVRVAALPRTSSGKVDRRRLAGSAR